jgi:hypothetical protein
MTSPQWILAQALALALTAAPLNDARATKPPPPPAPRLVAVIEGGWQSCTALFAIDAEGTVYVDCGVTGNWQFAGQVVGTPVYMTWNPYPRNLLVTMANGEVWAAPVIPTPPYTFTLLSNVFTAAGSATRVPVFAPLDSAQPSSTSERAPDTDDAGAQVVK